jgi:hypothetical protein
MFCEVKKEQGQASELWQDKTRRFYWEETI